MIALALLYFAATGQPVWVQDGPTVDDAWYCQVLLVLAGGVLVRIDNEGAPYLIVIPIREIRAVRRPSLLVTVDHEGGRVQRFKTDAAVYQRGPDALGLPAKKILFVSSNGWDAIGATWFGYTTLWVNRTGGPLEQLDTEPTRTGSSLRDVLGFFPSA